MYRACGYVDKPIPEHAISREEKYWKKIIENGGGGSAVLTSKDITENGLYNAADDEADGYSSVNVDVPNTYLLSDEGKVVNNGRLISQTSSTASQNGIVDTTLINSLNVNVPDTNTTSGILPYVIHTSETALRSWIIYGNNYEHTYSADHTLPLTFNTNTAGAASDWSISGNDNVGKNLLKITATTQTINDVTFTVDKEAGTITANGKATVFTQFTIPLLMLSGNYYFSGCASGGSSNTYYIIAWDNDISGRAKQWDGLTNSENDYGATSNQIKVDSTHNQRLIICIRPDFTADNLVFKPMIRLPDTSADFEPYQVGVGQRTENLWDDNTAVLNKWVSALGVISTNNAIGSLSSAPIAVVANDSYILKTFGGNAKNLIFAVYDAQGNFVRRESSADSNMCTFTAVSGDAYFYAGIATPSNNITLNILKGLKGVLVKGSTAPSSYVPFGYEIPISVNGTSQSFYIGDSPLTAGQSISKTLTGVDITAVQGTNTITTDLYNKPEMSIEGVDYVGVGAKSGDDWQIPLAVTCDRNLFNIYGNMGASGGVHTIDYDVETSSITGEMSADSFYILGFATAIVKGDETFVISFDKTTAGTAELRMKKGTGSAAETIETFDISEVKSYRIVFECEESFGDVYPYLVATEAATNTFEHIMIKKASDKGGFVPYGAKYEYNVPIDAPLTEGESITDTVTINTFEGENTLDTTLTNKPNMDTVYIDEYNNLINKTITQNGTYSAADDSASGYSKVTVNVPAPPAPMLITKTITVSGIYTAASDNADGYSEVTVNIRPYSEVLDQGLQAVVEEEE